MAKNYNRIETDNTLLDEIVYNCKTMMSDCVLKDEIRADLHETVDSLRNANIFISIIEGRCKFEYFSYDRFDFLDAGVSPSFIDRFMEDHNLIPNSVKTTLTNNKIRKFRDEHEETNNYYRKLLGLPDVEDTEFVYITRDDAQTADIYESIITTPIHLLGDEITFALEATGVLDDIVARHPSKYYLKYLTKGIDLYTARKAEKFGLIYLNTTNVEPILSSRFKELVEKNRVYIIKTVDFRAYEFYSDYYDRFLMMMIIVQTVTDMVDELPEYYIRRDIFDIRTIEYFFEANGVEFFPDIPIKYQKLLIKNLNRLIKYKSTSTNIVDICSLFGFSNIEIFKYYLCKTRNIDDLGNYIDVEDDEAHELKFLKVPLDDLADETAKKQTDFMIYDTVVSKDPYWNGPYEHDYVKQKILEHEFNMVKSKYISIDTVYSLTDATFELSYFINMIMFNKVSKNRLNLIIPIISISREVNLVNVFIYLYALMYEYNGVVDDIITTPSGYLKIKGFNFDTNMATLGEYVKKKGYSLKDLGVSGFQIPSSGILSFNQLTAIFINNKRIYDHIVYEMEHTDDRELYKIYKYIYDSLMLTDLNFEYYYIRELGRVAETFTEFLQYNDIVLYNSLMSIKEENDEEKRSLNIYNTITNISTFITDLLDNSELSHIFINLPTESGEYIKTYMYKVINFFKSYKINILDIQTIYKLDKENKVYMFDEIWYQYYFIKKEVIKMVDKMKYTATISRKDRVKLIDKYTYNVVYDLITTVKTDEKIAWMLGSSNPKEYIDIIDKIEYLVTLLSSDKMEMYDEMYRYNYVYNWGMKYDITDTANINISLNPKESVALIELMEVFRIYIREYEEDVSVYDNMIYKVSLNTKDVYTIEDTVFINRV